MAQLADLAEILTGVAPASGRGSDARFVQIRDLAAGQRDLAGGPKPTAKRASPIAAHDIIMAARAERSLAIRPDDGLLGAYVGVDLYLVRPDSNRLDPDYLAAFLNLPTTSWRFGAMAAGTNPPRIPKDAISELDVPTPQLARQRAIGQLARCIWKYRELAERRLRADLELRERYIEQAFARTG